MCLLSIFKCWNAECLRGRGFERANFEFIELFTVVWRRLSDPVVDQSRIDFCVGDYYIVNRRRNPETAENERHVMCTAAVNPIDCDRPRCFWNIFS